MRVLYSILITLGTPLVLLYFALRGIRDRAYLGRWSERFGMEQNSANKRGILVHAASVGEVNAASPLIKSLLEAHPELPVMVTTLTPSGSERVKRVLGDRVFHSYIPFDLPFAMSRFLGHLQPRVIIVIETEIWPNLYLRAQKLNIPLMIANARLTERSTRHYQFMSGFMAKILNTISWVGAQSSNDADRFIACGADPKRTYTPGNLKFDLDVPESLNQKSTDLRSRWGPHRPVLVAGSTHEADEVVVIPAFLDLLKQHPDALLILVPRHPKRFARTTQLAQTAGLRTELRSQSEVCSENAQCFVIDSLGELMTYYACADVAFVGGSMGDQGGHNALEPAALGKPVLFGPNMDHAREIASQLLECKGAQRVNNVEELQQAVEQILADDVLRNDMGRAGQSLLESNKGALNLTLVAVDKLL